MSDFSIESRSFEQKTHMKKIIIIYGLIAGAIVSALMLITMPMYKEGSLNLDNGEVVGYTTMVIAFSVIFVAIKSYRDKHSDGVISFWQGVKIGLLITLIASVMYGLTWEYLFNDIGNEFMQKMTEHRMTELESSGATAAEIQAAREEMAGFVEMYKNPLIRFTFSTFVEIFPVGLIITLISAALIKRKEFLPATEPA